MPIGRVGRPVDSVYTAESVLRGNLHVGRLDQDGDGADGRRVVRSLVGRVATVDAAAKGGGGEASGEWGE
eukprot:scaffold6441_cov123-Isochrysis_galbana.AAC.2